MNARFTEVAALTSVSTHQEVTGVTVRRVTYSIRTTKPAMVSARH